MKTTEVFYAGGCQVVKLPDEFRLPGKTVSIRKAGEAVILEPIKSGSWPEGFFKEIRIDDPSFVRPAQGQTPPAPVVDSSS